MFASFTRAALGAAIALAVSASPAAAQSNAEVQRRIRQSVAAYPGSCPCPYSVDRAGRSCGARSAWSRRGGHAPLCYPSDVRGRR